MKLRKGNLGGKRQSMSYSKDKRVFASTANKVRSENSRMTMRGGDRL